jgi:hypothetical protein
MAALFISYDGSHSQERYVAVGTRVCGVFQIKRSILSSQGQIIFVSDPKQFSSSMAHAPRKKSLEELKAEAIAELERRGLNVRGKTPAQIRKLLRLRFKKRSSNQTETRRADQ